MTIPIYQIDAFTDRLFRGNPAAVCPLDQWPDDDVMQAIAAENNLAETAFFIDNGDHYHLRWFTPVAEVDLCGHATLATAYVLFNEMAIEEDLVQFETRSGRLTVSRGDDGLLVMDFPILAPDAWAPSAALDDALGAAPCAVLGKVNCIAVFDSEAEISALAPDMAKIAALPYEGVIVTAPGDEVDFVSRCFAPKFGIPEDPVTGSAHCELAPYWSQRLDKRRMVARQVSARRGDLICKLKGGRLLISGRAVKYLQGVIWV